LIGEAIEGNLQIVGLNGERIVDAKISDLEEAYKKTLRDY
jgi:hypothetical protein